MKIVTSRKIIDLDKFETVRYRESLFGDGYPVEAKRHKPSGGGYFGGTSEAEEEIVRLTSKQHAEQLVADIANAWINGQDVFNVTEWLAKVKE